MNPLKGGKLIVNESYFRPKACKQIYPLDQELRLKRANGFVEVELPEVAVHSVLVLEG